MGQEKAVPPPIPYTRFSVHKRRYIVALLGYVTLASSLTATIYFPVIELLSSEYSASIQEINLTITLYIVFQAVAPAIFAPMADSLGRRPVLLFSFLIYVSASVGLALNRNSYGALLSLRGLQSLGGSAVLGLAYGVVADMITPAERGSMLGPLLATTNLGPCIGPVLGGLVARQTGSSVWCFWTLAIFGVVAFVLMGFTLPETARTVVGNGAVQARGIWRTWWELLFGCLPTATLKDGRQLNPHTNAGEEHEQQVGVNEGKTGKGKLAMPNPLAALRIVFYKDTCLILWMAASVYTVWYCIQTSIPIIFGSLYGWNQLYVGLSYLAGGSGVIIGGFIGGRMMDANYKHVARQAGLQTDRVVGDDVYQFPLERARSRGSISLFVFSVAALVGLGWSVKYRVHPAVPLVFQFLIGAQGTITHQAFNALLVDIFPDKPSTAAAAGNITRCGMSAAAVACVNPLVKSLGYGWFFTMIGIISGSTGVAAILVLCRRGERWRNLRRPS
ncbi:Itaconate transport protein like [Verticillium longisporum]|uniref:Itaconate transport protein like n=1 Tax=Verticillium longisporum TaxID=100787 RepID=A0A8I2ZFI4_VERLO|nr:Itaconate transport protein like [Verticillium longisporum]